MVLKEATARGAINRDNNRTSSYVLLFYVNSFYKNN